MSGRLPQPGIYEDRLWSAPGHVNGGAQPAVTARAAAATSPRPEKRFRQVSRQQVSPSVRACIGVPLRRFQGNQHGHGAAEKEHSAAVSGNVLVVAGTGSEEVMQLVVAFGMTEQS